MLAIEFAWNNQCGTMAQLMQPLNHSRSFDFCKIHRQSWGIQKYQVKLMDITSRSKLQGSSSNFLTQILIAAPLCSHDGRMNICTTPSCLISPDIVNGPLYNEDLAPVPAEKRTFGAWDMAALWIGLVVGLPSYYLAGSLVEMGMSWWQGLGTVVAGNIITALLCSMLGHAGTKYGIPFSVLARAPFGVLGAHIPVMLRALIACGWFGIETWIGGQAIFILLNGWLGGTLTGSIIPWLGTSVAELCCFIFFWVLQVAVIYNGMESIRKLEKYCAPILIILSAALLIWAYIKAGGFGTMLSAPSLFVPGGAKQGQFWQAFFPALTANVAFWGTLSLNMADFTRYSQSQVDQIVGHLGLPIYMGAFAFVGLAVTSASEVIFGKVVPSPVDVLGKIGGFLPTLVALLGVILATLTTNIAANVVASANALVSWKPKMFTYRMGAMSTAVFGLLFLPWRLMQSSEGFINTWLVGYSALLGPLVGIFLVDYYVIRKTYIDLNKLYSISKSDPYWYTHGVNVVALVALVAGILPTIPGFLHAVGFLSSAPSVALVIYDNAWFSGCLIAAVTYWLLSLTQKQCKMPET